MNIPQSVDADTAHSRFGHQRGLHLLQAAWPRMLCATTAERGGEPPPGAARYSRQEWFLFVLPFRRSFYKRGPRRAGAAGQFGWNHG